MKKDPGSKLPLNPTPSPHPPLVGGNKREVRRRARLFALLLALATSLPAGAQTFDSGSTGADGDLNVTANTTLALPADGVFNYRTVTVATGATLTFTRNALNTPVYILATGNITVAGTISVNGSPGSTNPNTGGLGGPGGFDGGDGGGAGQPPGDGHGPGGGRAGNPIVHGSNTSSAGAAAYGGTPAVSSPTDGAVYGSPLLIPLVGGSGGGGGSGSPGVSGSGGGGAILLASNTRVEVSGAVTARGGSNFENPAPPNCGYTNQGSGGAIRLVAPIVRGNGTLSVTGGEANLDCGRGDRGGLGRIRIDTYDRTGAAFSLNQSVTSWGAAMLAFTDTIPRLDVVLVASQNIPVGSGPVEITLPSGSPASQPVRVRATDFTGMVPIRIDLVPDSGSKITQDATIDTANNPDEVTVNMNFPLNVRTRVEVYTR
jgi:hypothetical protein